MTKKKKKSAQPRQRAPAQLRCEQRSTAMHPCRGGSMLPPLCRGAATDRSAVGAVAAAGGKDAGLWQAGARGLRAASGKGVCVATGKPFVQSLCGPSKAT